MKSLQGHFLVASPYLADPNFVRTVVLLVQHNKEGAFGLVLNRPSDNTIRHLWEQVHAPPCENDQAVHVGGPVSGPLMALHTLGDLSELEIVPGIYFAAERGHLEQLVERGTGKFKLFIGHSGWGAKQLENELEQGAWLTVPATSDYVFLDDDLIWKRITSEIGRDMLRATLKIKEVPDDPSVN